MKVLVTLVSALLLLLIVVFCVLIAIYWQSDRSVEELKVKWAKAPSQFVQIEGMQVHIRDEGPRDDPSPIVLLHGTSSSLHTWDGWVENLKTERRVIRFDMPGFGLTGPSPDNNYTIENYARIVIAVLDTLNVKRCILGGNSLGGYVAWASAVLYPDRIEQLALIDSSGYPFSSESVPIAFTIANTPILNKLLNNVLPRSIIESSLKNVYGDPTLVSAELIDRYYDLTTRTGNRQALVERFNQTKAGLIANKIPNIEQPTLIMWGGLDRLIPFEIGQRFDQEIENSQLVLLDDLGHVPHEEDPLKTVSVFKEFISKQK